MEFVIETEYTTKAMTAMARALRKTVRKKRSRRSFLMGFLVVLLGCIFLVGNLQWNMRSILTFLAVVAVVIGLLFQDQLNGYIAKKQMLPEMERAIAAFHEEGYHSETAFGSSDFSYDKIQLIAENRDFFVFIFSSSHAQVYAKQGMRKGTPTEFKDFLYRVTQKEVISF